MSGCSVGAAVDVVGSPAELGSSSLPWPCTDVSVAEVNRGMAVWHEAIPVGFQEIKRVA